MTDPRTGRVFTEEAAWEYVADQIDAGVEIDVVELDHPPGKKAYAMKLPSHDGVIPIYVKLQISSDKVIGRSFHPSNREAKAR